MELFTCKKEKLAEILSREPLLYNSAKYFLETSRSQGVLNEKVGLINAISMLEEANVIARDSDYFVFEVFDSWAQEVQGEGGGQLLYQNVNNKLVEKLTVRDGFPPQLEEILNFLEKNDIRRVYTFDPNENSYFGIKPKEKHSDGHVLETYVLHGDEIDSLVYSGIEVIVLGDYSK